MKKFIISLIVWLFSLSAQAGSISERQQQVISCEQVTLSKPGLGRAFQGNIKNDDYAFSVEIPAGLIGWDGVDQMAPFHGFTIFLDSQMNACINFEIHVRVDESDAPKLPRSSKSVHLGDAQAWQSIRNIKNKKMGIANASTLFSFRRGNQTFDGEVLLISPTSQLTNTKSVYHKLIATLAFQD